MRRTMWILGGALFALALGGGAWVACESPEAPRTPAAPVSAQSAAAEQSPTPGFGEDAFSMSELLSEVTDSDDVKIHEALLYELGRFTTVELSNDEWEAIKKAVLANPTLPPEARALVEVILDAAKAGDMGEEVENMDTQASEAIRKTLRREFRGAPPQYGYNRVPGPRNRDNFTPYQLSEKPSAVHERSTMRLIEIA